MTLKQLEAFYWAATCRNFAVAAQRVNLSLSSLSKRIAELEASLGQTLFDRAGHRAVLTEAGERLHLADLQALITPGAQADVIHSVAVEEGMIPITQAAVALARKGLISLTEAWRVRSD